MVFVESVYVVAMVLDEVESVESIVLEIIEVLDGPIVVLLAKPGVAVLALLALMLNGESILKVVSIRSVVVKLLVSLRSEVVGIVEELVVVKLNSALEVVESSDVIGISVVVVLFKTS